MDDLVRLGRSEREAVARLRAVLCVQTISLHQDVGDTGGFKQHAAIRNDYQESLHVLKCTLITI